MDWANHFWQVFNYFQKSIRARWGLTFSITEHCFGHQIVNFSTIVLIFDGYALLQSWLAMKLKSWSHRTVLDKFLPIYKKVSELFRSPNIVLVTKSSNLVQLCWFLVDKLQISPHWGWNKQNALNDPFWTSFYLLPESIHARWGLTFSITEHCFGHQIVNFLSNCAHFWWVCSTLAVIGDEMKKLIWPDRFGQVFYLFTKKYPNFFDHRTLFWWPNRQI